MNTKSNYRLITPKRSFLIPQAKQEVDGADDPDSVDVFGISPLADNHHLKNFYESKVFKILSPI